MLELKDWSYSRYSTWKKCPRKLLFSMTIEGEKVTTPAMDRGTDKHSEIENFLLGTGDLSADLEYYREFLTHLKGSGAVPEMPIAIDANWKMTGWKSNTRWWRGVLDCVVETDDYTCIYDWKTGNEYDDHREQREIYAAAYHSVFPVKHIRVFHVYIDKKQNTTRLYDENDIEELKNLWVKRVEPMFNDKHFIPNPGFHCRFCQYRAEAGGPCAF